MNETKNIRKEKIDLVVKCIALYFVMMPFDSFPMFGLGSILKIVAIIPIFVILILHRENRIHINKLTGIFVFYVMYNLITCFYSINIDASVMEAKRLILNAVLILVVGAIYQSYNYSEVNYLIKALSIGGIATAIMTLIFSDTSHSGRLTISLNGAVQDQNYINGYILFAYAYCMNKVIDEKKFIYLLPSLLFVVFTLMTGSRGALLAFAVISVMIFIFNAFNTGKIRFGVIIMSIIIVIIILLGYESILDILPSEISVRFSADYIRNYKGTNRTDLWIEILKIFNDGNWFRKIFGYGYGTVPLVNTFNHLVAHNLWLDHLVSGGVIGILIMSFMHAYFLRQAWKEKNSIVFSVYTGYLVMCMTLSLTNYKPLWNAIMMIMILYNARRKKKINNFKMT